MVWKAFTVIIGVVTIANSALLCFLLDSVSEFGTALRDSIRREILGK